MPAAAGESLLTPPPLRVLPAIDPLPHLPVRTDEVSDPPTRLFVAIVIRKKKATATTGEGSVLMTCLVRNGSSSFASAWTGLTCKILAGVCV